MFENITDDERGQVGIGTLIVFIAMVLVAAIAAGVLVNTAGFLQATAEDAGQESVNKVTNRVQVLNSHGIVGNNSTIKYINMSVRLAAGSSSVDMNDTSIKYLSGSEVVQLTNDSDSSGADSSEFGLNEITDDDGSFGVLNSMSDRYEVIINAGAIQDEPVADPNDGLETGETVRLEITSRTGGTTTVILTMPQQLAGKETNKPVKL
ncbi:archaellin/type IV pilin N-terminal domain-containing protein [Haloferax sp. YSMS24]|uniref:archaellin/type IV pilin N-terminal domain-containing protein n=1 Tax=Haloferax sp. YSMS24 TaxID=3388425 RepID=UPI00398CB0E3